MINESLASTLAEGINNPDCAFFVGYMSGEASLLGHIWILIVVYALLKALDKLAVEPLLGWAKKKFWGGKDD